VIGVGTAFAPVTVPCTPKVTLCPGWRLPLELVFTAVTALADWVTVALHELKIFWSPA
jgi:hypothetical protein